MDSAIVTPPNGTEYRAIVDTHRHPIGPKLAAKMAEAGLYDPKQEFPQTNPQDLICYREFFDLDYAMPKHREGGVTLSANRRCGAAPPVRSTPYPRRQALPLARERIKTPRSKGT
jgi:hypothetical protein